MAALGLVQQERPGERIEHLDGRVVRQALLQPGVVRPAHPGQLGHLLTAQAWYPPVVVVQLQPDVRGSDLRPTRLQEPPQPVGEAGAGRYLPLPVAPSRRGIR